ncbi:MAG: RNA polymerase sigma factor [Phycisphaerae bacterium]|nr:RNA polymerase sigma factor [Phycisphaerae bacterium]
MSAEELARRSQQGCRASFAELAERYGLRLLRFLRHQTNNVHDAEDLVQDTFVRAYANIYRYRSSYKFSTWLFTIARRLACSHLRRQGRSKVVFKARPPERSPGEELTRRETHQSLWETARTLTANQYGALWLKYAEDMPIKEIAKVMGKSQVSVKVTLYRARVRLAERLQNMAAEGRIDGKVSSEETEVFMKVEGA